ncbi:MAG TPA: hypothetical protein VLI90_15810 [Tepidisphaeraceae bacterium]|nr:hypothetical protein [Tepidisphaeraceae bacterium]
MTPRLDALVIALAATHFAAGVAMLSLAVTRGLTAATATRVSASASFVALPGLLLLIAGALTLIRHPLAWRITTIALEIAAALLIMLLGFSTLMPMAAGVMLGDDEPLFSYMLLGVALAAPAALAFLPAAIEFLLLSNPAVQAAYQVSTAQPNPRWWRRPLRHLAIFTAAGLVAAMASFQII